MSPRRPLFWAILSLALAPLSATAGEATEAKVIDFNRDVRPILSENCFACHGFDKNKRKADLRLDTRDGLLAAAEGGTPVVVPGKPEESELFERVTSDDPDLKMPPPGKANSKTLSAREVETLRLWIAQGADWKGHWAFLEPVRPPVPAVAEGARVANPIDAFILAKLADAGLSPSPEADRAALIRRVSFDLTGLPPSPREVREFVEDSRPDAYERVVDRLLASPHHGERMAEYWLDLVRFADTIGYHSDNPRNIWPYRDYVIDAFNKNVPFDRFTVEQVAGDLLPDAGVREKVASGYNRLLQTTEEGGAQAKEYAAKYAADRVRNASTVWLGATMGCAECHDHKFDPFLTKDFYRFAAFFADIQEPIVGKREPGMPVPDAAQAAEIARMDGRIEAIKARLADDSPGRKALQDEWEASHREEVAWTVLEPETARVEGESSLRKEPDGVLKSFGKVAATEVFVVSAKVPTGGITGFRVEALADPGFPGGGPGTAPQGAFTLTEFKVASGEDKPGGNPPPVKLAGAVSDAATDGQEASKAIDGKDDTGWSVGKGGGSPHVAVFNATGLPDVPGDGPRWLTFRLEFRSKLPQQALGKFRISATTTPDPAARWVPPAVHEALVAEHRTEPQRAAIAAYFRATSPALRADLDALAEAVKAKQDFMATIPTSLVSISGPPRTVRVLPRGDWMSEAGEVVEPGVPAFLPAIDAGGRRLNRLDLARWLVSRENPLTARVFVNRLWKLAFGQGISKVLDDLGSQGEWPSHPDLLDWLAVEFMDSGWDIRHMVRLMVTSATYRQSSRITPEMAERDPYNRLLAHQSRARLDAEAVRDNALAVSGLLVPKIGGPSVKPYQPAGYWDALNFPPRTWQADAGEAQYRRGLYTFWQRTFPQPSLLAFDAPSREECTAERPRSNIPQQALALLNDPSYVEAARAFAERIVREGGSDLPSRIGWAFETALSRRPTSEEVRLLIELHDKHLASYRADEGAAKAVLSVGERPIPKDLPLADQAAWASVARTILNLHETITRP